MITTAIEQALIKKRERNYPLTFWAIDAHATIIKPTYSSPKSTNDFEFYLKALDVLRWLSSRSDQVIILWTSTNKKDAAELCLCLLNNKIYVNYVNENPLCPSTDLSSFDEKFYFDILLDDKAGFDPEKDWSDILKYMKLKKEFWA